MSTRFEGRAHGIMLCCDAFAGFLLVMLLPIVMIPASAQSVPDNYFDWSKAYGEGAIGTAYDVAQDVNGKSWVVGDLSSADLNGDGALVIRHNEFGDEELRIRSHGGTVVGRGVVCDAVGSVYIAGRYHGSPTLQFSDIGVSFGASGEDGFFVVKFFNNGSFGWIKAVRSTAVAEACRIALVAPDVLYVAGTDSGAVTINGDTYQETGRGLFICRMSSTSGTFNWFAGMSTDGGEVNGIAADSAGCHLAGTFADSIRFHDAGLSPNVRAVRASQGGTDLILMRYDSAGLYAGSIAMGGFGDDAAGGLARAGDGDLVQTMTFSDTVRLPCVADTVTYVPVRNPGAAEAPRDFVVGRLDPVSLRYRWSAQGGGPGDDVASDIVIAGENLYITGSFRDSLRIGSGKPGAHGWKRASRSAGKSDLFIAWYRIDGVPITIKGGGTYDDDFGYALILTDSTHALVAGSAAPNTVLHDRVAGSAVRFVVAMLPTQTDIDVLPDGVGGEMRAYGAPHDSNADRTMSSPEYLVGDHAADRDDPEADRPEADRPDAHAHGLAVTTCPNPFVDWLTVSFTQRRTGSVDVRLFDMMGQPVATLLDEVRSGGAVSVRLNGASLPNGMYVVRVKMPDGTATASVIVSR